MTQKDLLDFIDFMYESAFELGVGNEERQKHDALRALVVKVGELRKITAGLNDPMATDYGNISKLIHAIKDFDWGREK